MSRLSVLMFPMATFLLAIVPLATLPFATPAFAGDDAHSFDLTAKDEGAWISLGEDAFSSLRGVSGFGFNNHPLRAVAQHGDAVVTEVRRDDLSKISDLMHELYLRCPGFILHDTQAEAVDAIRQAQWNQSASSLTNFTIDQQTLVQTLEGQLVQANILATVQHLSTQYNNRYYAHPSGASASTWIRDQWLSLAGSRSDVTVQLYSHSGYSQSSVVFTIQGSTLPDEVVVLGGHLDSTASGSSSPNFIAPGADDNASGIAVITEVIRVLMAENFVPDRTVKFFGYAAEEVGLRGSGDIAADHQTAGTNVVSVVQFDMTAFNGSTEDISFIQDYTNADLTTFIGQLVDEYQPNLSWSTSNCGYACSDHASWHNRGFPAAMPFEARMGQHNQAIHTQNDTVQTFGGTVDHSYKFARLGVAYIAETGLSSGGGGGGGGGTVNAAYSPTYGAPFCAQVGNECDSVLLLQGRNNLGPEPNQPNTIDNCTDGGSGTFHSDESNDRIVVRTADGTDFAPGKTVQIQTFPWAWSTGANDTADFYYAADASNPTWTFIASIGAPAGGAINMTAQYILPSGPVQAVRVNFRYNGAASPCSGGNYDDADDLVFAVDDSGGGGGGSTCAAEVDFSGGLSGWAPSGTCSTGTFLAGTPAQMSSGSVITQVSGDHTGGGSALYTAPNTSAGSNDVDGGTCIATSPDYAVSDASDLSIWHFHGQRDAGDDAGDGFVLEYSLNGGTSWTTLQSYGDVSVNASWTETTASIPANSTVKLRVQVSDANNGGDIVEGGVDDLTICPTP